MRKATALAFLGLYCMLQGSGREHVFSDEDRSWWAIQPVIDPEIPSHGENWCRNEIDRFVARKLDQAKLSPAPAARPGELMRRVYFDLHGLPPTPKQMATFLAAYQKNPDEAYEQLLEELLNSPRYGERWATHWLDVARYADSDGYRADGFRPGAYLYRDYVIRSLNADKPYDQFIREQLAADEFSPNDPETLIATAFLRHGVYEWNQREARMQREIMLNEITKVTSEAFLGLGLACAQCHDHKFDPLLQKDYYALQSFLSGVWWPENRKIGSSEDFIKLKIWENETQELRAKIKKIEDAAHARKKAFAVGQFPDDVKAMYHKPASERTPEEEQLAQLVERQVVAQTGKQKIEKLLEKKPEVLAEYRKLKKKLEAFAGLKPDLPNAFVSTDVGPRAALTFIPSRSGKTLVEPAFLSLLGQPAPKITPMRNTSGRRSALAKWIANKDNPLSTRVIVNRIWQRHFGKGIVPTPNDFGTLGEPPSHPELLDWLTMRFVENGWRMKTLHKLVMTSATYRQTTRREPAEAENLTDPGNRLLWRFPPRRLSAEQTRDAMLAVSGELIEKRGGPPHNGDKPVRSIYLKKMRNSPEKVLQSFDSPAGFESTPTRLQTTTPTQSLLLANGDWPLNRAKAFATKLLEGKKGISSQLVDHAFLSAFGRPPTKREMEEALNFLTTQEATAKKSPQPKPDKFPDENGLRPIAQAFGKVKGFDLGEHALWLQPGSRFEQLEVENPKLDLDAFTIEAVASLDKLHPDASVNTLISQWNGNHQTPGWTFGVTSAKSAYQPRNFILQLIGENVGADVVYEVVASNLRIPTGKPVYLAAVISTDPKGQGKVTFHFKDLSDPDAKLQTAEVDHGIAKRIQTPEVRLLAGGRDQRGHLWDGQLARLVLSPGNLTTEQLLIAEPKDLPNRLIDWSFQGKDGERPTTGTTWLRHKKPKTPNGIPSGILAAVTDFCHALLTANEFLYLH
tara:strand:+ start:621 stop:3518 length:2898 start_codon:yes stop_codon:yes gene_type:complete